MAGYVTQTRIPYSLNAEMWTSTSNGQEFPQATTAQHLPYTQTTTSFRSKSDTDFSSDLRNDAKLFRNGFESNPKWDRGHAFSTKRTFSALSHRHHYLWSSNGRLMHGAVVPQMSYGLLGFYDPGPISDNDIKFYGTKAIAQVTPTTPVSSVSTLLGELMFEFLPESVSALARMAERARFFRSLGDTYLLAQFGWAPFLREITSIMHTVVNASRIVNQYYRDSGQPVRRRYHFNPLTSIVQGPQGNGNAKILSAAALNRWYPSSGNGPVDVQDSITTKLSFSGEFMYHANVGSSNLDWIINLEKQANLLLGTRVTPEVLWNIAPWSWLVDWKLNIGDFLSNATRFSEDSLVLRYGYLMRHTVAIRKASFNPGLTWNGKASPTFSQSNFVVKKERVKATPYGFGIDPATFSNSQWLILAALGLSKGNNKLP